MTTNEDTHDTTTNPAETPDSTETALAPWEPLEGFLYNIPDKNYFAATAISRSFLSAYADMEDTSSEEKAHFRVGSLTHTQILEPDQVEARYVKASPGNRGTKKWKEEEAEAKSAGKKLIKTDEWDAAELMALSIREHTGAMELLTGASYEVSIFWRDPDTHLMLKARPDVLGDELADVKTTISINPQKFTRALYERRYDWADAYYTSGLRALGIERPRMVFIAVEKTAKLLAGSTGKRHRVGLFEIPPMARVTASEEIAEWLGMLAYSMQSGQWPTPTNKIQMLGHRPPFIHQSTEDEDD